MSKAVVYDGLKSQVSCSGTLSSCSHRRLISISGAVCQRENSVLHLAKLLMTLSWSLHRMQGVPNEYGPFETTIRTCFYWWTSCSFFSYSFYKWWTSCSSSSRGAWYCQISHAVTSFDHGHNALLTSKGYKSISTSRK